MNKVISRFGSFEAYKSGAGQMLLAAFWFALMNVFVKKVSHLPAMELVFFRCTVSSVFCFAGMYQHKVSGSGSNKKLLLLRGFFGTAALYLYFLTVQNMPLGTAVSVQYLSPIFTVIIASILLKEKITPLQMLFSLLSFSGVLFIKGFDARISLFYLGIGILSSVFSSFAYNMIRSLSGKEHPLVVVLHFQLMAAIIGFGFTLFNWVTPQGLDWLYLFLVGASTQLGQMAMTRSLQKEKISKVSILTYTGIIYAIAFGYFLFGETYGWFSIFGMIMVVAGVVLNILYGEGKVKPETV
ncbi:MAG TPA: DMT family transporter [Bacteroidia bacterium]|nr:DMT family transporter [Bacteroidia bacterium]